MTEKKKKNEILYLSFNRNKTCLSLGMQRGYRIYDLTKKDSLFFYERIFGKGIGIIEMIERTNILGLVGGGDEPLESPNKLNIYDDKEGKYIANINFKSVILNIRLKKDKILVILEDFIYLLDTVNYNPFDIIKLGFEKKKHIVFSFTLEPDVNNLAYSSPEQKENQIIINIYDKENKKNSLDLKTNYADNNIISCIQFDKEGKLLAVTAKNSEFLFIYSTDEGIPLCKCSITNNNLVNSLYISFEELNEFVCVSLDNGEVVIINIKNVNYINFFNQNKKEIKEKIWSKVFLPERKSICAFAVDEIGNDHIICFGTKGNYYLVKYDKVEKENLALKIKERNILKIDN